MTQEEKINAKLDVAEGALRTLGWMARHNGAAIDPYMDTAEIARRCTEVDMANALLVQQDIMTIDRVKNIIKKMGSPVLQLLRPEGLTTEDLMTRPNNDPELVVPEYTSEQPTARRDWAVVKITKTGTEILSVGGVYYQAYEGVKESKEVTEEVTEEVPDETTGEVTIQTSTVTTTVTFTRYTQQGDTDLLRKALEGDTTAWHAKKHTAELDGTQDTYTESGITYYVLPIADIPSSIEQLLSLTLKRSAIGDEEVQDLSYMLTDKSCALGNDGMIGLPHGIWLIYDNTTLQSAPKGLLLPKALVDGTDTGILITGLEIAYNVEVSGLSRLRLVSSSYGEEYIISTQDDDIFEGAWTE